MTVLSLLRTVPYYIDTDLNAQAWDRCTLGDIKLPGIASLNVQDDFSFDVGKAQGHDGAPVTYKGRAPRTLELTLQLISESDFDSWLSVRKQINAFSSGKVVKPYEVGHPNAIAAGVRSAYVKSIKQPQPTHDKPWVITISLIENNPAKVSKQSSTAATKGTTFASQGLAPLPRSQVI